MWYVYILLCADSSLYTGISPDPQKRLLVHQNGKGGHYTRAHKPVKIIYTHQARNRSEAQKREAQIKSWSREEKIHKLQLELS